MMWSIGGTDNTLLAAAGAGVIGLAIGYGYSRLARNSTSTTALQLPVTANLRTKLEAGVHVKLPNLGIEIDDAGNVSISMNLSELADIILDNLGLPKRGTGGVQTVSFGNGSISLNLGELAQFVEVLDNLGLPKRGTGERRRTWRVDTADGPVSFSMNPSELAQFVEFLDNMRLQKRGTGGVQTVSVGGTMDISYSDRLEKSEVEDGQAIGVAVNVSVFPNEE